MSRSQPHFRSDSWNLSAGAAYSGGQWQTSRLPASEPPGAHVAGGDEDKGHRLARPYDHLA